MDLLNVSLQQRRWKIVGAVVVVVAIAGISFAAILQLAGTSSDVDRELGAKQVLGMAGPEVSAPEPEPLVVEKEVRHEVEEPVRSRRNMVAPIIIRSGSRHRPSVTKVAQELPLLPPWGLVRAELRATRDAVQRCYDKKMVPGEVQLTLTVRGSDGRVVAADAVPQTTTAECVTKVAAEELQFPRFRRPTMLVRQTYDFR